jgi:SAM-dependent methyltransferase
VSLATDPAVTGDAALQDQVLEDLASAVNHRRWLCELARPYLGGDALEIGSGLGHYAETWLRMGERVTASEGSAPRAAALRARLAAAPGIAVRVLHAPVAETGDYSAVVAFNVLEHIPDDVAALRSFAGLVRAGGRVVLVVPAFGFAMSGFDRAVGHQRRYTVPALRQALEHAGLRVERIHYVNWLGLLAWVVMMKWLNGRPRESLLLRVWDGVLVPLVRFTERWVRPPFGQSVFAVAVKAA